MRKHGHGQIFGPGRADGPFPEHYEPLECPIEKNLIDSIDLDVLPSVITSYSIHYTKLYENLLANRMLKVNVRLNVMKK